MHRQIDLVWYFRCSILPFKMHQTAFSGYCGIFQNIMWADLLGDHDQLCELKRRRRDVPCSPAGRVSQV